MHTDGLPLHDQPNSTVHVAEQPSPLALPPSSQPSPASSTPLPQQFTGAHKPGAQPFALQMLLAHDELPTPPGALASLAFLFSILHSVLHPSFFATLPSSQPSPASSLPLPQVFAGSH
jgi:hypothetical protein